MDYTPKIVRFILTHYLDIRAGGSETGDQGRSPNRGNPNEGLLVQAADVSSAISCLCKPYDKDLWPDICQLPSEMMRARAEELPPAQRYVVKNCIFGECRDWRGYQTPCQFAKDESHKAFDCKEAWAIARMVDYLNRAERKEASAQRHEQSVMRIIEAMSRATSKAISNLTKKK